LYQEKEMRILMNKRLFDKRCHYSIRKFAIGAASVMIGASIFGISAVQAEEVASSNTQTGETTVHQAQPLDKLPDDVAAALPQPAADGGGEGGGVVALSDAEALRCPHEEVGYLCRKRLSQSPTSSVPVTTGLVSRTHQCLRIKLVVSGCFPGYLLSVTR